MASILILFYSFPLLGGRTPRASTHVLSLGRRATLACPEGIDAVLWKQLGEEPVFIIGVKLSVLGQLDCATRLGTFSFLRKASDLSFT